MNFVKLSAISDLKSRRAMNAFPEITENLRNWTNTMQKHILTNAVSHGGCDEKCMFRNHVRKSVSNSHTNSREFTLIHENSRGQAFFLYLHYKKTKYVFSRFLQNSCENLNICKIHAKFENSREFTLISTKIDENGRNLWELMKNWWTFMKINEIWLPLDKSLKIDENCRKIEELVKINDNYRKIWNLTTIHRRFV